MPTISMKSEWMRYPTMCGIFAMTNSRRPLSWPLRPISGLSRSRSTDLWIRRILRVADSVPANSATRAKTSAKSSMAPSDHSTRTNWPFSEQEDEVTDSPCRGTRSKPRLLREAQTSRNPPPAYDAAVSRSRDRHRRQAVPQPPRPIPHATVAYRSPTTSASSSTHR